MRVRCLRVISVVLLALLWRQPAQGYALLTHEQLIDLTWRDSIVPLLLSRYPNLTPEQLEQARAYAYGGCVIQDLGYYPFGDGFYSDLTHYVRSGDFVVNLFRNAQDANELAFAIGALSHYIGDSIGHPEATNRAVAVEFPKLERRYGKEVNYAEGRHQHVQTEFGFDINQIAHHRMAPLSYDRHVGLGVPVRLLEKAFYQTYGVTDFNGYHGGRFNVREYRFAVRTFIPRIAYALTVLHRRHEPVEPATADAAEIEREVAVVSAANHWDRYRHKPGFETYALACLIFVLPKFGPLSLLKVRNPTPKTEAEYMRSLRLSAQSLRRSLRRFTPPRPQSRSGDPPEARLVSQETTTQPAPSAPLPVDTHQERAQSKYDPLHPLPNRDLDTGHEVQPGGYPLTDSTYADLLHRLARHPQQPVPPGIVHDIQAYYSNLDAPFTTKRHPQRWAQVQSDLKVLATMPTSRELQPFPTYGDETGQ